MLLPLAQNELTGDVNGLFCDKETMTDEFSEVGILRLDCDEIVCACCCCSDAECREAEHTLPPTLPPSTVTLPPLTAIDLLRRTRTDLSVLDNPNSAQSIAWDFLEDNFENEIQTLSTSDVNARQSLTETFALIVMYYTTGGPTWTSDGDSWLEGSSVSPCDWHTQTVTCDNPAKPNRVSKISLSKCLGVFLLFTYVSLHSANSPTLLFCQASTILSEVCHRKLFC